MAMLPDCALVPFKDAGALFPECFRPTLASLYRYANVGIRGVKLKTTRIGGRRFTSAVFVAEFIHDSDSPPTSPAALAGQQVLPCL